MGLFSLGNAANVCRLLRDCRAPAPSAVTVAFVLWAAVLLAVMPLPAQSQISPLQP